MKDTKDADVLIKVCPICSSQDLVYRFVTFGRVISACSDCGHLFANPQNSLAVERTPLYDKGDFQDFMGEGTGGTMMLDCLDAEKDPVEVLTRIHGQLEENGRLFLFVPSLDSKNARHYKQRWEPFRQKRLHFFSNKTIQNLLCKCGYGSLILRRANDDGVFVSAKRVELSPKRVLSVIIPVYNERNTVNELLNAVYHKNFDHLGLQKEIIVIESNSTDGTRGIVKEFVKKHTDVKLILEDRPRGKGHAVRNGFASATGDFITIQDGDLEYDLNDYDKLLLPLVKFQEPFILGSRHTGDWQMRNFGGEHATAFLMNVGQILFTALINAGCGTKLKDPFTMYKLFRRECLSGLTFDANRFEIDWEIVIKLVRKGFIPVEIPVNYSSRGMKEGKKVSILRDPVLWVVCFIRYRFFYKI